MANACRVPDSRGSRVEGSRGPLACLGERCTEEDHTTANGSPIALVKHIAADLQSPQPPAASIGPCLSAEGYRAILFYVGAPEAVNESATVGSGIWRSAASVVAGSSASASFAIAGEAA